MFTLVKKMTHKPLTLPTTPTHYSLPRLGIIRLEGEERVKYLHSQVTCDVQSLQPGQHCLGGHCDPKGKLWNAFHLLALEHALYLIAPQDLFPKALAELRKYAVFSKVTITDVSAEHALSGVTGNGTDQWMANHGIQDGTLKNGHLSLQLASDRWILIDAIPLLAELPQGETADWWAMEILAGQPIMSAVHQGEYIPQMLNLQALGGISFRKGCYTGQETVARAKYRGANNRSLFILQGQAQVPLKLGATLELQLGEHWKRIGSVIDLWQKGEHVLLTAVLPQELEPSAILRFKEDEHSRLRLLPLPYALND